MATDHMAEDPSKLSDQQLIEVCLEIPSSSVVGLRYHMEKYKRDKRKLGRISFLALWAAFVSTLTFATLLFLFYEKLL